MRENNTIPADKVNDVLLTRTAIKTLKPEYVVQKIISFQFKDAREATKRVSDIEISGFGKLIRSEVKTRKKKVVLERTLNSLLGKLETASGEKRTSLEQRLEGVKKAINTLKNIEDGSGLEGVSRGNTE